VDFTSKNKNFSAQTQKHLETFVATYMKSMRHGAKQRFRWNSDVSLGRKLFA
jgi:hypothetical protein